MAVCINCQGRNKWLLFRIEVLFVNCDLKTIFACQEADISQKVEDEGSIGGPGVSLAIFWVRVEPLVYTGPRSAECTSYTTCRLNAHNHSLS